MSAGLFDGAEVISAYSRQDAIADGVLIDVTANAKEAGFVVPVALTAGAWADAVAWPKEAEDRKPHVTGQDEQGRLWDVLWMGFCAIRRAGNAPPPTRQLGYQLLRVPTEGRGLQPRLTTLTLHSGPGDLGEQVITIMRPGED